MEHKINKLPLVRRARDYHLFDPRGGRCLDLFQNGGRALLGHRPAGLGTILKNELQKGVLAEAPSVYDERLRKALARLLPGPWQIRVYRSFDRALLAAGRFLGAPLREEDFLEPFSLPEPGAAGFLRPFAGADYSAFSLLFPILPFPGAFAPQPVFFNDSAPAGSEIPPEDPVSPFLAAGLLRVTEGLQKTVDFPDIWKDWKLPGWQRFGRYCFPEPPPLNYREIFDRFLASGVLLSPDPRRPTILPGIFSPGEKVLVERLCRETAMGVANES